MIKEGEVIVLDNDKEYFCLTKCNYKGVNYLYLVGNFTPAEVMFAKEVLINGQVEIEEVNGELKSVLLDEFNKLIKKDDE